MLNVLAHNHIILNSSVSDQLKANKNHMYINLLLHKVQVHIYVSFHQTSSLSWSHEEWNSWT